MEDIQYSNRTLTLGEMADIGECAKGDYGAMIRLIVSRTNLPRERVLELDLVDAQEVIENITKKMLEALTLVNLAVQLDRKV